QGCHASWRLWRAAMIVRTLPEAPRPAVYARRLLLQERKIRLPYQRTIAEQPDPVLAFKTIQALVGIEGIAGHGDGSGRGAFMRHDSGRLQRGSGRVGWARRPLRNPGPALIALYRVSTMGRCHSCVANVRFSSRRLSLMLRRWPNRPTIP